MRKSCRKTGFTIIELVGSLSVCFLLVLTCGVLLRMSGEQKRSIARSFEWQREAQLIHEVLKEDLISAHGRHWHEGNGEEDCEVGWFSLKSRQAQSASKCVGNLCAVGYRLVDQQVGGGRVQRNLLRQQLDSAEVFEAIMADDRESLWQVGPEAEALAQGVLLFELWPLLRDDSQSWQPWYSVLSAMPEAVELRLVLASPELQERLKTSEDWDAARWDMNQLGGDEVHELRSLIVIGQHAR